MSITNYLRPQLRIKQLLDITPTRIADRLNPVIIGPAYHIEGYDAAAGATFVTAGQTVAYGNLPEDAIVDVTSVKLFANGLELATISDVGTIDNFDEPNVVKLDNQSDVDDLRVGDVFYVNPSAAPSAILRRRIVGFRGVTSASSYDATPNESSANPSAQVSLSIVETPSNADFSITSSGTFAGLAKGAVYAGKYGDLFTVRVTTPGTPGTAVLSIRSNSGLYDADNVATTDTAGNYVINSSYFDGLTITIVRSEARDLVDGDVIAFQIKAPYVAASTNGVVSAGDTGIGYTGTKDTNYLVRVLTGGALGTAVVQVTDTAGIDVVQTYTPANNTFYALGSRGLRFKFNTGAGAWNGGLKKGDVYFVAATAASESNTTFDKVVLDGPAADTSLYSAPLAVDYDGRYQLDGEVSAKAGPTPGTYLWTADVAGVDVVDGLSVTVTGRGALIAVNAIGKLSTTYRAIVPPGADEGVIDITDGNLVSELGAPVLANTLAFGAAKALSGAQGKVVKIVRTAGTDLEAFTDAFNKLRQADLYYALVALSTLDTVQQALSTHVTSMSAENVKNFRRAYVGTDSPVGGYGVVVKKSDASNYTATVSAYMGANTRVTAADALFISLGVSAGDELRINYSVDSWGEATYETYKVKQLISETELILKTGPSNPINPAVRFELWKPDTAAAKVAYVKTASRSFTNRRVANVWVDNGTAVVNGVASVIPNMFVAAEIAGLRCAVLPQQGLTNTEITSVTNAPSMYLKYSQAQLDEIAAEGTFIVAQDVASGAVYIRHQLTTRTAEGSLYYEDSVGVNLDNISYGVKDILSGYIGKRNANDETLAEIKKQTTLYLNRQVLTSPTNAIGSALISFTDPAVELDAVFKDTINVSSQLIMPLPLNQIKVTLRGSTQV